MGIGNLGKMMKQVQKMQAELARIQEEAAARTVEATAGGGAVTVEVSGDLEVKGITIKPEAIDPDDPELLEDLVVAAVNEGLRQARDMVKEEMDKVTGGMGLPNIPGLT